MKRYIKCHKSVAKVKMAVAREILRFTLKKQSYFQINFLILFDIPQNIFFIFGKKKDEDFQ